MPSSKVREVCYDERKSEVTCRGTFSVSSIRAMCSTPLDGALVQVARSSKDKNDQVQKIFKVKLEHELRLFWELSDGESNPGLPRIVELLRREFV